MHKFGSEKFSKLFKRYRLLSQFKTLNDFGNKLAGEGFTVENSTLSRWQNGSRKPTNRPLLLRVCRILIRAGGIENVSQVNQLLKAAGQNECNEAELHELDIGNAARQLPPRREIFIGKDSLVRKIYWAILNDEPVVVYGIPGSGRSTTVLETMYKISEHHNYSFFWFNRANTTKFDSTRILTIKEGQFNKKMVCIFGNAQSMPSLHEISQLKTLGVGMIFISAGKLSRTEYKIMRQYKTTPLSKTDAIRLAQKILGKAFVVNHRMLILKVCDSFQFFPLALVAMFNKVREGKLNLEKFSETNCLEICLEILKNTPGYLDDFNLFFNSLLHNQKKVLIFLSVLGSGSFSNEDACNITNFNVNTNERMLKSLVKLGLLTVRTDGRYSMHPIMLAYAQHIFKQKRTVERNFIEKQARKIQTVGLSNVKSLNDTKVYSHFFSLAYKAGLYQQAIILWEVLFQHLWHLGDWDEIQKYTGQAIRSYQKLGELKRLALFLVKDLGWFFFWKGDLYRSHKILQKGLSFSPRDPLVKAIFSQRYSLILQERGRLTRSKRLLKNSVKTFSILKEYEHLLCNYIYIGHSYRLGKLYRRSLKYYDLAYSLAIKYDYPRHLSKIYYYLGETYFHLKNYKKSEVFFNRALKIDKKDNRKAGIAWCHFGLSAIAKKRGSRKYDVLIARARVLFNELGMMSQIESFTFERSHSLVGI